MSRLVCIVCPNGCTMDVNGESPENITITGNKCKRGFQFAVDEMTCPKRTICSTVKTSFPDFPVLPVRVSSDIPKAKIFDVMAEINKVTVTQPLGRGEPVIKDVLGLGVDVIATSDILLNEKRS